MTQKDWEKKLKRFLQPLPRTEQVRIVEYYREMYGDKRDAGMSEAEILAEFGDPQVCAGRMISESADTDEPQTEERPVGNPYLRINHETQDFPPTAKPQNDGYSVGEIVGLVCFTLLLLLPLAIVALSLVITFGALCVSGAGIAVGGVIFTLSCPFHGLLGVSGAGIAANIGMGLALCGVGLILFVGFFYATKYTALGVKAAAIYLYKRRKGQ